MKRITSTIILFCLTLSLMAQNGIKVNFKGSKPTVTDFAWAAFPSLNHEDEEESGDRPWIALEDAMKRYSKGLPLEKGEKLTIDSKNGYILYENSGYEDVDYIFRLEVCYWNESDGKHQQYGKLYGRQTQHDRIERNDFLSLQQRHKTYGILRPSRV